MLSGITQSIGEELERKADCLDPASPKNSRRWFKPLYYYLLWLKQRASKVFFFVFECSIIGITYGIEDKSVGNNEWPPGVSKNGNVGENWHLKQAPLAFDPSARGALSQTDLNGETPYGLKRPKSGFFIERRFKSNWLYFPVQYRMWDSAVFTVFLHPVAHFPAQFSRLRISWM